MAGRTEAGGSFTWTSPQVTGATVHLLGKAGARRIRLLESPMPTVEPLEEFMLAANWEPQDFLSAAPLVEFENTNHLGHGKEYARFMVPHGGLMFKGYDLNHSYADCDVSVSLAKLQEHVTAGVTLSMKNCFGMTPCTNYGEGSPEDGPGPAPMGGTRTVPLGKSLAPQERTTDCRCQRSQGGGLSRSSCGRRPSRGAADPSGHH